MTSTARHAEGANPPWFLTPVILLTMFVLPISIAGTAIALPDISRDLGDSPTALQWVVNGFNVSFALFTLVWGALSDRLGHKRTFMIGSLFILGAPCSASCPRTCTFSTRDACSPEWAAPRWPPVARPCCPTRIPVPARSCLRFAGHNGRSGPGRRTDPLRGLVTFVGWQGVFAAAGAISIVALLAGGALPKDHRHPVRATAS